MEGWKLTHFSLKPYENKPLDRVKKSSTYHLLENGGKSHLEPKVNFLEFFTILFDQNIFSFM